VIDAEGNVVGGTAGSVDGTTFSSGPGTGLQQAAGEGAATPTGGFRDFSETTVQSGGFPVGIQRNQLNSSLPVPAAQPASAQAVQAQRNFAENLRTAIFANGATQVFSPVDNSVITVISQNGAVTLQGNVSSPQQRATIEQQVRSLANLSSVNNQLTVNGLVQGTSNVGNFPAGIQVPSQPNSQILEASGAQNNLSLAELAAQQQQTFNQDLRSAISSTGTTQVFSPQNNSIITVISQNGTITLRGLVRSAEQSQAIERAVQSLSNGTVENELQISQFP
jgi:osmotically-inducible protein OsmY